MNTSMSFIPLPHVVEVSRPVSTVDRYGNQTLKPGSWEPVSVAAWWVDKTETGDPITSVLRTIEYFHAYFPVRDQPGAGGRVRTPDGRIWTVEGTAENYEHGPFGFSPGLVVVHGKEVIG